MPADYGQAYTYGYGYEYPMTMSQRPQWTPTNRIQAKLAALLRAEGAPTLETTESLLASFLKKISPSFPGATDKPLRDLWQLFAPACAEGIEVFLQRGVNRPWLAAYAPTLSGLHIKLGDKLMEYNEKEPPHVRLPLLNKVELLESKSPLLTQSKLSSLEASSW